jgi:hypothetical protein
METPAQPQADLPPIRPTVELAALDLKHCGLARVADVMSASDRAEALEEVMVLAEQQRVDGTSFGGRHPYPNQRVYGLLDKGGVWRRAVTNSALLNLMHKILGNRIILFSLQVYIVNSGDTSVLHIDQMHLQPPIQFPGLAVAMIMLDDFTEENGATRVIAGSHRIPWRGNEETRAQALDKTSVVTGPAGTMVVYDGLLWHAVGINKTGRPRRAILAHYCLPWMRQFENFACIDRCVREEFTPELQALLAVVEGPYGEQPGLSGSSGKTTAHPS